MSWGAIYTKSWWGNAIANDFGEIYQEEVNINPLLEAVEARSTYYENEEGTKDLLRNLQDCSDE